MRTAPTYGMKEHFYPQSVAFASSARYRERNNRIGNQTNTDIVRGDIMVPSNTSKFVVIAVLSLAQPCSGQPGMMGQWPGYRCCGPMMGQGQAMQGSMYRHHLYMMYGIDPRYQGKVNPLPSTREKLEAGKNLYSKNCASCHGPAGLGDGEAGRNLSPRPANIAAMSKRPMASDAYLYWTIAEGGQPIGSAMPTFKQSLSESEIWEIIGYLRTL